MGRGLLAMVAGGDKRMSIAERGATIVSSLLKRYGPSGVKKRLWDKEFSEGKWDFIDDTAGDCVYAHVEKHARKGSILDLGCGPGNTANELDAASYQSYIGVDISEAALLKAAKRSKENGRGGKNSFLQGDFFSYQPPHKFDVILFRESLYHVPLSKVKAVLDRYAGFLKDGGVFVVRIFITGGTDGKVKHRPKATVDIIEAQFEVLEKRQYGAAGPVVIVFRPRPA
jgi:SAM-dependent methyltransferase